MSPPLTDPFFIEKQLEDNLPDSEGKSQGFFEFMWLNLLGKATYPYFLHPHTLPPRNCLTTLQNHLIYDFSTRDTSPS